MVHIHQCLRIRDDEVAAKVIDGEAVIINLASGNYYSMDKAGGLIWEMIQAGHSLEQTVTALVACYEVAREQAEDDVLRVAAELVQENLVIPSEDGAPPWTHASEVRERRPYVAPNLNAYREMGDLLALDPPVPGLGDLTWKAEEPSLTPQTEGDPGGRTDMEGQLTAEHPKKNPV
jgi:hypothetical protein